MHYCSYLERPLGREHTKYVDSSTNRYGALFTKTLCFLERQEYYVNGKFLCPQCGAKFTRWANLQKHLERKDHTRTHRIKKNSDIESFKNSETNDIETFRMDNFKPTNYLETNLVNEEGELIKNDHDFVVLPHNRITLKDSGIIENKIIDDPLAM